MAGHDPSYKPLFSHWERVADLPLSLTPALSRRESRSSTYGANLHRLSP
jgi:hypothetical protein